MLVFVVYDISDTKTRSAFVNKLRYFGLRRIQKSVFSGILTIEDRFDLVKDFDFFMSSEKDSIVLIPVCESCEESIFIEGEVTLPKPTYYKFV